MSAGRHRCPYCGANPDGDLVDCIAALLACNNCKCDIAARELAAALSAAADNREHGGGENG